VSLDTAGLTTDLQDKCISEGSGSVLLTDYSQAENGYEDVDPNLNSITYTTADIDILIPGTDGVDCTVVQDNAGTDITITVVYIGGTGTLPSTCTLPYDYPYTLPTITGACSVLLFVVLCVVQTGV
jgi:hypothetical protein